MLYPAKDFGYINEEEFEKYKTLTVEVARMLSGLVKSLD